MLELLQHIENVYAAAETPAAWKPFVETLCSSLNASSGAVMALDGENRPILFQAHGVAPAIAAAYDTHYHKLDRILARSLETTRRAPTWAGLRHELISDGELEATEYFQDFMKVYDQFHQVGLTLGANPSFHFAGITLLRGSSDGVFDQDTVQALQLLGPHLRRSLQLQRTLRQAAATDHAWHAAARQAGMGMLLLNRRHRVVRATPFAETLLKAADGILCRNGILKAASPLEGDRLNALLHSAVSCSRTGIRGLGGAMRISRTRDVQPIYLSVMPAMSSLSGDEAEVTTYVFLSDRTHELPSKEIALQQLFGLSSAEARLVGLLVQGCDLRTAGTRMKLTENSVRFMSKSIFSKMEVSGQRELLLLVLRLPGWTEQTSIE